MIPACLETAMWDPSPYVEALVGAAPEGVRQHPTLEAFILDTVMAQGERRPDFIHEAADQIRNATRGFVYDRASGLIFFSAWADHERTAACLMALYGATTPADLVRAKDEVLRRHGALADRYLDEGRGFVANSPALTASQPAWPLHVGNATLTAQEKLWFSGMALRRH
jgi:hypothetical protein